MIVVRVSVTRRGSAFRRLATADAPSARRRLVNALQREALARIIDTTPVVTGRARKGWIDAAEDRGGDSSSVADDVGRSVRRATNLVSYVRYLEYGTRRMAPQQIVQRSLAYVRPRAVALFQLRNVSVAEDASDSALGASVPRFDV